MLKRSLGARFRRRFLDRIVNGPIAQFRKQYGEARRRFPHERIGNLTVYGNAPFVADVAKTLSILAEGYPYGYSLVQRYICAIEPEGFAGDSEKFSSTALSGFGARAEKTTSEGRLPVPAERYAAFLIRIAADHKRARLYAPKSQRADSLAQKREARAMKILLRSRGFA